MLCWAFDAGVVATEEDWNPVGACPGGICCLVRLLGLLMVLFPMVDSSALEKLEALRDEYDALGLLLLLKGLVLVSVLG